MKRIGWLAGILMVASSDSDLPQRKKIPRQGRRIL